MRIERGRIVTLAIELLDEHGGALEEAEAEEVRYRHGDGELFPALEAALEGLAAGDERDVRLAPEEAFGPVDPEAIFSVPRESFPPDEELERGVWITIGVTRDDDDDDDDEEEEEEEEEDEGEGEGEDDFEEGELEARVVAIDEDEVVLDANHPLAGRTVVARARVLAVEAEA